jgi:hypothetical protein
MIGNRKFKCFRDEKLHTVLVSVLRIVIDRSPGTQRCLSIKMNILRLEKNYFVIEKLSHRRLIF